MQIVIDIPEANLKALQIGEKQGVGIGTLERAVLDGTPLPKGHGRLKDVDAIKPIKAPIAPLTPEDTVHYEWVYMKSRIDKLTTIIEADKEEEE